MEALQYLIDGFRVALIPINLLICAVGVVIGTLVGAMPGIGPTGAVAMLLAATYKLGPTAAIIMLAGIYYGAAYGGTITSVLMGLPGESSSVVTVFDGYQLAKQGKAGKALGIAAIGSFIGGTVSIIGLMLVGPALADMALLFGPAEYFTLMLLAFSLVTSFAGKSLILGLMSLVLGLILSTVGQDLTTGLERFTFDQSGLLDGIGFLPVGIGLFGLAEIINDYEKKQKEEWINADLSWKAVLPSLKDIRESFGAIVRGSLTGFFAGMLPGVGATIASFMSYGIEKRCAKNPELFGKGAIQGVAGPETANNAVTGAAFIPMLSLGIPAGATSAVLLGALIMFGLQPGPTLFREAPELVWGMIASMYIGNIMLVIINIAFIPVIVYLMNKLRPYLSMVILLMAVCGVYSYSNSSTDVLFMISAGFIGYLFKKMGIPGAPLILGILLGEMAEQNLRQSLIISLGNPIIFVQKPIAAVFLFLAMASVILGAVSSKGKGKVLRSDDVEQ